MTNCIHSIINKVRQPLLGARLGALDEAVQAGPGVAAAAHVALTGTLESCTVGSFGASLFGTRVAFRCLAPEGPPEVDSILKPHPSSII